MNWRLYVCLSVCLSVWLTDWLTKKNWAISRWIINVATISFIILSTTPYTFLFTQNNFCCIFFSICKNSYTQFEKRTFFFNRKLFHLNFYIKFKREVRRREKNWIFLVAFNVVFLVGFQNNNYFFFIMFSYRKKTHVLW